MSRKEQRQLRTIDQDVEFIRLFFRSAHEEEVAVRIAGLLAATVGERITELRPETRLGEILDRAGSFDSVTFVMGLEQIMRRAISDEMASDFEHMSFRELVECASE